MVKDRELRIAGSSLVHYPSLYAVCSSRNALVAFCAGVLVVSEFWNQALSLQYHIQDPALLLAFTPRILYTTGCPACDTYTHFDRSLLHPGGYATYLQHSLWRQRLRETPGGWCRTLSCMPGVISLRCNRFVHVWQVTLGQGDYSLKFHDIVWEADQNNQFYHRKTRSCFPSPCTLCYTIILKYI